MATRYWWLRLQEKFFNQKPLRKLRRLAGGDTFTIIYLKMQLLSITTGGTLRYEGIEGTFAEELSLVLDEHPDNVQVTLSFLERCGLLEQIEQGLFLLPEAAANIGSESASAERMRRMREKRGTLPASQCDAVVTQLLRGGDADNNRQQNITVQQTTTHNNVVVELEKFGLPAAAIAEIRAAIDEQTATQLIAHARANGLGAGWLRRAARDPAMRPPLPGSEAAAERPQRAVHDPQCPRCAGTGIYTLPEHYDQQLQQQYSPTTVVCDCNKN